MTGVFAGVPKLKPVPDVWLGAVTGLLKPKVGAMTAGLALAAASVVLTKENAAKGLGLAATSSGFFCATAASGSADGGFWMIGDEENEKPPTCATGSGLAAAGLAAGFPVLW